MRAVHEAADTHPPEQDDADDDPRVSVIVPAIDEEDRLPRALASVGHDEQVEVIVVDGGSRDGTVAIAEAAGARVIHSPPGRGVQMNAGAQRASAPVLLFLHADTCLPPRWQQHVDRCLSEPNVAGGAFRLAFNSSHPGLRLIAAGANCRASLRHLPYGDQAIFVRRDTFVELEGFGALPIMEDYQFIRRLRRRGRIAIAPEPVTTSGRRWMDNGLCRTTLVHQCLLIGWHLGVPAEQLARWRQPRVGSAIRDAVARRLAAVAAPFAKGEHDDRHV